MARGFAPRQRHLDTPLVKHLGAGGQAGKGFQRHPPGIGHLVQFVGRQNQGTGRLKGDRLQADAAGFSAAFQHHDDFLAAVPVHRRLGLHIHGAKPDFHLTRAARRGGQAVHMIAGHLEMLDLAVFDHQSWAGGYFVARCIAAHGCPSVDS